MNIENDALAVSRENSSQITFLNKECNFTNDLSHKLKFVTFHFYLHNAN